MPFNDLPANRQTDAGSFIDATAMQALKRRENAVEVFLIEPYAVILDVDFA